MNPRRLRRLLTAGILCFICSTITRSRVAWSETTSQRLRGGYIFLRIPRFFGG